MTPHVRIYMQASGLHPDEIMCEVCGNAATDIHHIQRRGMGGSRKADRIENLMALCRTCHDRYGDRREWKEYLQSIHNEMIESWQYHEKARADQRARRLSSTRSTGHFTQHDTARSSN